MGTLAGAHIRRLVDTNKLVIKPFLEELVQPATYDLRLGSKILASPLSKDILGAIVELEERNPAFNIQSGQMVAVISEEYLQLPLDLCARFGIRSEYARVGIVAFGGVQIDPGFEGHLTLNLLNVGPEPVALLLGKPFFSVEFNSLNEPAEAGYRGAYQGQTDFPQDQYEYILHARTTSLAEIPTLRQEVSRLSGLLEELEEKLPDPDEGLELKAAIESRLRRSLDASRDSLLSLDEMRKGLTAG